MSITTTPLPERYFNEGGPAGRIQFQGAQRPLIEGGSVDFFAQFSDPDGDHVWTTCDE